MVRLFRAIRRSILPAVGRLLAKYAEYSDVYATSTTDPEEYVGLVAEDCAGTVEWLREQGFVENPVAAYKDLDGAEVSERASLAWRGDKEPLRSGEDVPASDAFADRQLHVILFELDGDRDTTAVFAHWEYSWLTHPVKHYRGVDLQDRAGARLARSFFHAQHDDFRTPPLDRLLAFARGEVP